MTSDKKTYFTIAKVKDTTYAPGTSATFLAYDALGKVIGKKVVPLIGRCEACINLSLPRLKTIPEAKKIATEHFKKYL